MTRTYLDHNATSPLRDEARAAMLAAMDVVGNPSSVHTEGRSAKMLLERARAQVADLVGADVSEIVFTSGATEAAAFALMHGPRSSTAGGVFEVSQIEHDCVSSWGMKTLPVDRMGKVNVGERPWDVALQLANSETGILQTLPVGIGFCDMVQAVGKLPVSFTETHALTACVSAHKLGGPKGVGALIIKAGSHVAALIKGGGQEMGRRSGTENIIGIAGFGAAAEAAGRDVAAGRWEEVAEFRNILENALEAASRTTIFVGKDVARLPNTSCILTPGWKGETQVMQMDLSGFAISAGSACSSGKVKASKVLSAMGYSDGDAASAIRVSLGLETRQDDILRFADAWTARLKKHEMRAA